MTKDYVKPFFVVEIPLDENGRGPIIDGTHTRMTWQIWDQLHQEVGVYYSEEDAERYAALMNLDNRGGDKQ